MQRNVGRADSWKSPKREGKGEARVFEQLYGFQQARGEMAEYGTRGDQLELGAPSFGNV